MNLPEISKDWSLFLDRDGVLNRRRIGDYVLNPMQFEWLPLVLEALAILTPEFKRTVIVTNQQGVGKGLMTQADLDVIHSKLLQQAGVLNATIDAVYTCTSLSSAGDPNRKPGFGMALQAKAEFPEIEFRKSIMVGDSISDMEFGKAVGMYTVFIGQSDDEHIDCCFPSLWNFANSLFPKEEEPEV